MDNFKYIWHGEWADPEFYFHGRYYNYWDIMEGIMDEDGNEKDLKDITNEDIYNELCVMESCDCGHL